MMNKIKFSGLAIAVFSLSSGAFAVSNGMYFGLQLGESNTHNKPASVKVSSTVTVNNVNASNTGFGGRFFFGYNFNQYAAWEMGYTAYASSSYSVKSVPTTGSNPGIRESSIDLVAKGIYPFAKTGFGIFGKAGLALMHAKTSPSLITSSNSTTKTSQTSTHPTIGFGVSYDLTDSWVTDLTYSRVFSGSGIQSADFIALGISYHFVDHYCGQFLCD